MSNKIIIGVLVLLVILVGGSGYCSYTLNQQIDYLGKQLTTYKIEQAARVDVLRDELSTLRTETQKSISIAEGKIGEAHAEIGNLEEEIGTTQNQISSLQNEIGGALSQVENLKKDLADTVEKLSGSILDASEVYQRVSQATVRINDGQITIGSGFILDSDGHVVTAYHVVENLSQIYVILPDGTVSKASRRGYCQYSDIAVLELEDNPAIEPPPLVDSSRVRIGEPVVAIGSPLDLRDTLTAGIISQVNQYAEIRDNTQSRWVANLLQFDAAVNFGNSGCPLANADGEIIGIVVARIYPTEGDGIYYAVAANKVRRVAEALIDKGSFDYPWVGIGICDITPKLVQERSLETANGVLVSAIFSDSPAEDAGVEVDDIIVSIDDIPVRDSADLVSYLGEYKSPGDMSTINLIRGTTRMEIPIEIGKRQE
jgi:S1-C subfamily serine protease